MSEYFLTFGYVIVSPSWRHLESALWSYLVTHSTPPSYNAAYIYYWCLMCPNLPNAREMSWKTDRDSWRFLTAFQKRQLTGLFIWVLQKLTRTRSCGTGLGTKMARPPVIYILDPMKLKGLKSTITKEVLLRPFSVCLRDIASQNGMKNHQITVRYFVEGGENKVSFSFNAFIVCLGHQKIPKKVIDCFPPGLLFFAQLLYIQKINFVLILMLIFKF